MDIFTTLEISFCEDFKGTLKEYKKPWYIDLTWPSKVHLQFGHRYGISCYRSGNFTVGQSVKNSKAMVDHGDDILPQVPL